MFLVTTLEVATGKTFSYQVDAASERKAKAFIIAGIEAGTKRGDTVYECQPIDALPAGPAIGAYGRGGELQ